jgi:hypothetical protein
MNYKISIEGQEIDMPEEIAGDDAALKSALSPYFPGAANAKFMRSEPKDGVITVTVVKQAGTKGASEESQLKVGSKITKILDEFRRAEDSSGFQVLLDRQMHNSPTDQVLQKLINAPQGINPVVALDNELEGRLLNQMGVEKLIALNDQIDEVISAGQDEFSKMESTLRGLDLIEAAPSLSVVTGF